METIRVLGIAPYEGMKLMMEQLSAEYPQIDLTLFVGDLEQGLEIAKSNFHGNYDAVISRGGTARLLMESLPLPVVEIEISMYDILCAMKLANALSERAALVSYADTGNNAQKLSELMGYDIDVYPLDSRESAESVLRTVRQENYSTILCDMVANTTAQRLGLDSVLVTSGPESIRQAFKRVIRLCASQQRLRDENRFFRELLDLQFGETVLMEEDGTVYLSTMENNPPELLEIMRREIPETALQEERRITRNSGGRTYTIRIRRVVSETHSFIGFFFTSRKTPLPAAQSGIRYLTRSEAEKAFYEGVFGYAGLIHGYRDQLEQVSKSASPVLISGEDGTGKDAVAYALFAQGTWNKNALACINCSQLNDKGWDYILEHPGSPLTDEGNALYFSNIDILSEKQYRQLLAMLQEIDVCRRNKVLFSCVCRPEETMSTIGALFADELCCLPFYLAPLRSKQSKIPTLVNVMLSRLNADSPHQIIGVDDEAMELLCSFPWPHNYTQFRRVIGELAATSPNPVLTAPLIRSVLHKERHIGSFTQGVEDHSSPLDLNRSLYDINRDIVRLAVEEAEGNQTEAARRLGISRTTLWRYMKEE